MIGLKLKYNEDLLAIFPPDDGEEDFHAVTLVEHAWDEVIKQNNMKNPKMKRIKL